MQSAAVAKPGDTAVCFIITPGMQQLLRNRLYINVFVCSLPTLDQEGFSAKPTPSEASVIS